jgi:hypothetical protein
MRYSKGVVIKSFKRITKGIFGLKYQRFGSPCHLNQNRIRIQKSGNNTFGLYQSTLMIFLALEQGVPELIFGDQTRRAFGITPSGILFSFRFCRKC